MNKHTPGPWKIDNGGGMTYIVEDATNISICRVSANNLIANANLIAAAPDLLAALESVIADLELRAEIDSRGYRVLNISDGVLLRAGKAIAKAKAKGETK